MFIGLLVSSCMLLFAIIVGLMFKLFTSKALIKELKSLLEKEQQFREIREDSLAEVISEELSLPPGKRRLCYGCTFAKRPWLFGLIIKKKEILIHNMYTDVKPDDIDDLLEAITIPIYEENLIKKLVNISGRTI